MVMTVHISPVHTTMVPAAVHTMLPWRSSDATTDIVPASRSHTIRSARGVGSNRTTMAAMRPPFGLSAAVIGSNGDDGAPAQDGRYPPVRAVERRGRVRVRIGTALGPDRHEDRSTGWSSSRLWTYPHALPRGNLTARCCDRHLLGSVRRTTKPPGYGATLHLLTIGHQLVERAAIAFLCPEHRR
jgi:hypothetical protein